jgi:hypothetical protein
VSGKQGWPVNDSLAGSAPNLVLWQGLSIWFSFQFGKLWDWFCISNYDAAIMLNACFFSQINAFLSVMNCFCAKGNA